MYSPRKRLETPNDYKFPYKPYSIQQEFMESMYNILEDKGIGIFESPTGTGKSLTLTCAALSWLLDHEREVRNDLIQHIKDVERNIEILKADAAKTTDWITGQFSVTQQRDELYKLQSLHNLLQQREKELCDLRERYAQKCKKNSELKSQDNAENKNMSFEENDNVNFEDLEEEEENIPEIKNSDSFEKNTVEKYRDVQIFFCSRTHSQLAQVVREIKNSSYGKNVRCISLASRQQLCIHQEIRRLPNVALMNEMCLDMSRNTAKNKKVLNKEDPSETQCTKTKTSKSCPYKSSHVVQLLSDTISMDVLDIEELVTEGERTKSCPYYAGRSAIKNAQIVMLPYQMLLHRRTRIQTGIDLRGSIVIIDEAHNLLDTISQLYSSELTLQQLLCAQEQIQNYKMHYAKRFSTSNLLRINQLLFVVKRLINLLDLKGNETVAPRFLRTYELSSEGEFYNIDLWELLEFCEHNSLARKVQGFAKSNQHVLTEIPVPQQTTTATVEMLKRLQEQHQNTNSKSRNKEKHVVINNENVHKDKSNTKNSQFIASSIRPLLSFLLALTEDAEDGRILIQIDRHGNGTKSLFKYILLNPSGHFEEIVRESRAIIVAGGTMQPTTDLTEQLFRFCPHRVHLHFYDHVVSLEAVLPVVISSGPTGRKMCFNYEQRTSKETLSELGMVIQNLCFVVPDGVICFLPSYEYLEKVYEHLSQTGIIERISVKKEVFREARSNASGESVEKLLEKYANCIKKDRGALLFAVVGGKMSEGLNFADRLGRGVIVVGLPYPNRHSPELQERMNWLDQNIKPGSGNEYYENLCMKAVNQCIGRSVRHIRDYASVFLLDERYGREHIKKKLPQWISRNLQEPATFGLVQAAAAKFFREKRKSQN